MTHSDIIPVLGYSIKRPVRGSEREISRLKFRLVSYCYQLLTSGTSSTYSDHRRIGAERVTHGIESLGPCRNPVELARRLVALVALRASHIPPTMLST